MDFFTKVQKAAHAMMFPNSPDVLIDRITSLMRSDGEERHAKNYVSENPQDFPKLKKLLERAGIKYAETELHKADHSGTYPVIMVSKTEMLDYWKRHSPKVTGKQIQK